MMWNRFKYTAQLLKRMKSSYDFFYIFKPSGNKGTCQISNGYFNQNLTKIKYI